MVKGFLLFPHSPLCTCLSIIDNFVDHLFSYSQGLMRIHNHDALVNIVYNGLSQDHPGVRKEQRASHDDGSRLGDAFHPDFQDGRLAFFVISVRSTTLYLFICFMCWGGGCCWGGCQGWEAFGSCGEGRVWFYSLGGGNFWGLDTIWLKMLLVVADRSTTRSGVSRKLARKTCCSNCQSSCGWVMQRGYCIVFLIF